MRRSALALLTCALTAVPAFGQESCDVKVTLKTAGRGARLSQVASCGDGNSTTVFACENTAPRISVMLPVAPFDAKPGATFKVRFKLGGSFDTRELTASPPVSGGGGDILGMLQLASNDPLWLALARPGADIFTDMGDATTTVGMVSTATAKLRQFKKACGLK